MTAPLKIACIGEAMIELAFDGTSPLVNFARDTLNTAIYLRRNLSLTHSVSFLSVVGTDPFSQRMLTLSLRMASQLRTFRAIQASCPASMRLIPHHPANGHFSIGAKIQPYEHFSQTDLTSSKDLM